MPSPASGELAAASYVDRKIAFAVDRVYPMAEETSGRRAFKVRAHLRAGGGRDLAWMRPGMEGMARVPLGRRRLAWVLGRRAINWLKLWFWL